MPMKTLLIGAILSVALLGCNERDRHAAKVAPEKQPQLHADRPSDVPTWAATPGIGPTPARMAAWIITEAHAPSLIYVNSNRLLCTRGAKSGVDCCVFHDVYEVS